MPVCSLTAALTACKTSAWATMVTVTTITSQNVVRCVSCNTADRNSGGTSTAHTTVVGVSKRGSVHFQRRSTHCSCVEAAIGWKSPRSKKVAQSSSVAATAGPSCPHRATLLWRTMAARSPDCMAPRASTKLSAEGKAAKHRNRSFPAPLSFY